ncbi:MAG: hypothetical protein ACRENG_33835, partial [bacterium]
TAEIIVNTTAASSDTNLLRFFITTLHVQNELLTELNLAERPLRAAMQFILQMECHVKEANIKCKYRFYKTIPRTSKMEICNIEKKACSFLKIEKMNF